MDFVVKIASDGSYIFLDKAQGETYKKLTELYSRSGKYLRISVEENFGTTTDGQIRLFKSLVLAISKKSGSTYQEIYSDLHKQFAHPVEMPGLFGPNKIGYIDVKEMNREQFGEFLERCIAMANDVYDLGFGLASDPDIGFLITEKQIKK